MLNSEGKLRIRAYTAGGALPISGARVQISGAEEGNRDVKYVLLTDRDGMTEEITLPAPNASYSKFPYPSQTPYALYDVEISKDGYITKKIHGLPIFAGIESFQGINMIPLSGENYPDGNNDIKIPEYDLNF